jgi:hypothetical protein
VGVNYRLGLRAFDIDGVALPPDALVEDPFAYINVTLVNTLTGETALELLQKCDFVNGDTAVDTVN